MELAEHSYTATLSGGDNTTCLKQKLLFFFTLQVTIKAPNGELFGEIGKLQRCEWDLKWHSAIQPSQEKLPSPTSAVVGKATLETPVLCKGDKAWESPHCLPTPLKSFQLEM